MHAWGRMWTQHGHKQQIKLRPWTRSRLESGMLRGNARAFSETSVHSSRGGPGHPHPEQVSLWSSSSACSGSEPASD